MKTQFSESQAELGIKAVTILSEALDHSDLALINKTEAHPEASSLREKVELSLRILSILNQAPSANP